MSLFARINPENRLQDHERLELELAGLHREAQREDEHKRAEYHALHIHQDRIGWLDMFMAEAQLIHRNRRTA